MVKIILTAVSLAVMVLALSGCGSSGSSSSNEKIYTSGTIYYADGSIFGITKEEAPVNGGFNIYDIELIDIIGFIQMDGIVIAANGVDIGICSGASISDSGVSGNCNVPVNNPNNIYTPSMGQCSSEEQAIWTENRVSLMDFCQNYLNLSYAVCSERHSEECVKLQ